jgi:hypothetical protein
MLSIPFNHDINAANQEKGEGDQDHGVAFRQEGQSSKKTA